MWKQIWGQAAAIAVITVVVSIVIFVAIMLFLDFFYDFALWLGTLLFIGISAAAWFLGNRAEQDFLSQQSGDAAQQE